ncbi:hypothetical protein L6452_42289 [Arctium lappa]|uniref:Uncharacterized protein n=1 Tax=Arctium lappa TaxID=4217 RepID=A0ACB8XI89_ARCLA|nr:hypothetical protein L6452_42289 [Arctium lappa]
MHTIFKNLHLIEEEVNDEVKMVFWFESCGGDGGAHGVAVGSAVGIAAASAASTAAPLDSGVNDVSSSFLGFYTIKGPTIAVLSFNWSASNHAMNLAARG